MFASVVAIVRYKGCKKDTSSHSFLSVWRNPYEYFHINSWRTHYESDIMRSYSVILAATLAFVWVSADPSYEYDAKPDRDALTSRASSQNLDAFDYESKQGNTYDDNTDVENNLRVHISRECQVCFHRIALQTRFCLHRVYAKTCRKLRRHVAKCKPRCDRKGTFFNVSVYLPVFYYSCFHLDGCFLPGHN